MLPASVNVSASNAFATVDLILADDVSGISTGAFSLTDFQIQSPSGAQSRILLNNQRQLVSGTINNGTWRTVLQIPQFSEPGIWKIVSVRVRDFVSRTTVYAPAQLAAFGTAINLAVSASPADLAAPELNNLTGTLIWWPTSKLMGCCSTRVTRRR
jgi:hypothetical protein